MAEESSWMKAGGTQKRQPRSQRSIRDTIHLLMSLLSECGVPKIASESIRGAKFNQDGATMDLWKITFHVMQAATFLDGGHCVGSVDTVTYYAISPSNLPTVQVILRQYMFEMGYTREGFYTPTNHVCSRELLLAFSWLLHRTKFFSKLVKHFLLVAKRVEIPMRPATKYLMERVQEENRVMRCELEIVKTTLRTNAADPNGSVCTDYLHKLVWLKGELEYKEKLVEKLCIAHQTLADRIHRSTLINSPISRRTKKAKGHLSTHEVFLLRFPNQMKQHLAKLGKCVCILQKLIQWQDSEPLFWQWMESVLDLHDEEGNELEDEGEGSGDGRSEVGINDDVELLARVNLLQKEFEGLLKKKKPHMDSLEHVWGNKSRTVPHKDINVKLHVIREQLKYEYPLVATEPADTVSLIVEQLDATDCPIYTPVQNGIRQSRPALSIIPAQAEAESATNQLTQALHDQLETVSHQLGELDRAIEGRKREIRDYLKSMEAKLPGTLCKIDLGHLVHHQNNTS